jgi:deoxyribodipyrimidine photolyase-like uncharacterized protein
VAEQRLRHLVLVLGDQLDLDASGFDGFDATQDAVWMAEAAEESIHVWSSRPRIARFLSAMRHFAMALRHAGRPLHYTHLGEGPDTLGAALAAAIERLRPQALVMTAPGDWRVLASLREVAARHGLELDVREDQLLNPREVVAAAEAAYRAGRVPLASAEGFIRQVLGWREYLRGIYRTRMPGYLDLNALGAHEARPAYYWTGRTSMACLADTIGQTLEHGYARHIQRLMVTGLYALLLGVEPKQVHAWYLAVYVDAVEWVELPNTLGMSQAADGGLMASKPYIASGKYIERMSGYCERCAFRPGERVGERACRSQRCTGTS